MNELTIRPPGYFERLRELFDRIAELPAGEREVAQTARDVSAAKKRRPSRDGRRWVVGDFGRR